MKIIYNLILLMSLIVSNYCMGGNWLSETHFNNAKNKSGPFKSFYLKKDCESKTNEKCFNFSGKDFRRVKKGFRQINNPDILDCADASACGQMIIDNNFMCPKGELAKFDEKVNHPTVDGSGWFLWCEKEILVPDSVGSNAADVEDGLRDADKNTRKIKKAERDTLLIDCVRDSNNPTMTPLEVKNCLSALLKEFLGEKVDTIDL